MKHQHYTRVEIRISCSRRMRVGGVGPPTPVGDEELKRIAPNDNIYCTATSLTGPWSSWQDFATSGSNTFNSQTAAVVSINGVVM